MIFYVATLSRIRSLHRFLLINETVGEACASVATLEPCRAVPPVSHHLPGARLSPFFVRGVKGVFPLMPLTKNGTLDGAGECGCPLASGLVKFIESSINRNILLQGSCIQVIDAPCGNYT